MSVPYSGNKGSSFPACIPEPSPSPVSPSALACCSSDWSLQAEASADATTSRMSQPWKPWLHSLFLVVLQLEPGDPSASPSLTPRSRRWESWLHRGEPETVRLKGGHVVAPSVPGTKQGQPRCEQPRGSSNVLHAAKHRLEGCKALEFLHKESLGVERGLKGVSCC